MTASPHAVPTGTPPAASADNDGGVLAELLGNVKRIAPIIREHAGDAERERRLPAPVFEALRNAGLQRMFTPRSLGGYELDPVSAARVVEELALIDSAAAWSLQSGNVNAYWSSSLPEEGVLEIYGEDPSVMVAAAFHPQQKAVEVDGGYRVTGRSPLASMIHDCKWALFSALIFDDGKPRMTPFGPVILVFTLRAEEVEIIDTWHTLGMRGTDSNDAAFNNVFVPSRRTFIMQPGGELGTHHKGPLYHFPPVPIIALFSSAVLLANARVAIDELKALATRKTPFGTMKTLRDRATVQYTLAEAEGILRSARALFYENMSAAWERTASREGNTLEQKADLVLACIHAVQSAVRVTDMMHRLAGTTGIYQTSRLERCIRDALTLRQHGFVSDSKLESVGQIYLGLEPDFPFIKF